MWDARLQLINSLVSAHAPCQYDGLILGSSRIKTLGKEFEENGYFNFGFDDAYPVEYEPLLKLYEEECSRPPKSVVLSLDFFSSSRHRYSEVVLPDFESQVSDARNPLKMYTSITSLTKVLEERPQPELHQNEIHKDWNFVHEAYYAEVYGRYELDPNYAERLQDLTTRFSSTEFTVVITPVSGILLDFAIEHNLEEKIAKFVDLVLAKFPNAYNLMVRSDLSATPENWTDENHLRLDVAKDVFCGLFAEDCEFDLQPYQGRRFVAAEGATVRTQN